MKERGGDCRPEKIPLTSLHALPSQRVDDRSVQIGAERKGERGDDSERGKRQLGKGRGDDSDIGPERGEPQDEEDHAEI